MYQMTIVGAGTKCWTFLSVLLRLSKQPGCRDSDGVRVLVDGLLHGIIDVTGFVTALQRLPQVEIQLSFQIESFSFFYLHHRPHKLGLERNKELILFKATATCKVAAPKSERRSLRSAFDRLITNSRALC